MTLHPRSLSSIPEMTASVARTSFPKGNPYMKMRDELGVLYEDTDFLSPEWLRQLKAVEILRCVWIQQYGWSKGKVYWREADNLPPHKQLIMVIRPFKYAFVGPIALLVLFVLNVLTRLFIRQQSLSTAESIICDFR